MTLLTGPNAFYEIMQRLLANVTADLVPSLGGPVNRACVVPGEMAWDACDCGEYNVTAVRFFLSDDFPIGELGDGTIRNTPCLEPWYVAQLDQQIIRCAPSPGDTPNTTAVPCDQLDEAAQILVHDAWILINATVATLCEMKSNDEIVDFLTAQHITVGPDGGCVGVLLTSYVALPR